MEALGFGPNRMVFFILLALVVSAVASRGLTRVALRIGLADQPGGRKQHEGVIPVTGGIGMFLGFAASALASQLVAGPMVALVAALGLLVIAGIADDMHDVPPKSKFFVQLVAALLMTSWAGVFVSQLGDLLGFGPLSLYHWAIPFSVVCALGVINATNMVDGLDGSAGGISLVAMLWFALAASLQGLGMQAIVPLLLAASIAGFLIWNVRLPGRSRAVVFMGDAGSMMLGLALCWLAIDVTQGPGRTMPAITSVWILGVPLLDMGRVMFLRTVRRTGMFNGDRLHLHHYLLDRGYSTSLTALLLICASATMGAVGLLSWRLGVPDWVMFYAFLGIAFLVGLSAHRAEARPRFERYLGKEDASAFDEQEESGEQPTR
jgi:UDP-GlcNAc:undecaprenyl-phosphate/decaprenyl-phosphate GlcNAc-1-phosphate transferase